MLIQKLYFISIIAIIIITLSEIYINKRRKNREIIKLSGSLSRFIYGKIYLTLFIIFFIILLNNFLKIYKLLGNDYDLSFFQLLNFEYIDNLIRSYEEKNIIKHIEISIYEHQIYKSLLWIVFTLCQSISNLYIWYHKNIIYESGILINGILIAWQEIDDYRWGGSYENKFFEKGNYYELSIIKKRGSISLRVKYDDKNQVDEILKKYIILHQRNDADMYKNATMI